MISSRLVLRRHDIQNSLSPRFESRALFRDVIIMVVVGVRDTGRGRVVEDARDNLAQDAEPRHTRRASSAEVMATPVGDADRALGLGFREARDGPPAECRGGTKLP